MNRRSFIQTVSLALAGIGLVRFRAREMCYVTFWETSEGRCRDEWDCLFRRPEWISDGMVTKRYFFYTHYTGQAKRILVPIEPDYAIGDPWPTREELRQTGKVHAGAFPGRADDHPYDDPYRHDGRHWWLKSDTA